MTDAAAPDRFTGTTPDTAIRDAERTEMLAADGTPLKASLARSLRRQRLRAFLLTAPLLAFVLITFVAPIVDMLFRSVENQIVSQTLPRTVVALEAWEDTDEIPDENVFAALTYDLVEAAERREHTRLGSRLNYETTGISSTFRRTGRGIDDVGEIYLDQFVDLNDAWEEPETWIALVADPAWQDEMAAWRAAEADRQDRERAAQQAVGAARDGEGDLDAAIARLDAVEAERTPMPLFAASEAARAALPETATAYGGFARTIQTEDGDDPAEEEPWAPVYLALYRDLAAAPDLSAFDGPPADLLAAAQAALPEFETRTPSQMLLDIDDGWADVELWGTIAAFSDPYTAGYFLAAVDLQLSPDGIEAQPPDRRIYLVLFQRTLIMSLAITGACILLGYPIAYLLSNLRARTSNLLLILVLLPFWTSLLVRTSAWKVLLQNEGVINDLLVWLGLVADDGRLALINNQTGTIIAMTHILLPFMILPLYSVMKTIPPSYVRAAKSLGATNWTAFWRVYFPQSVPGIGAGSILVFILSIGYYITPELVGGERGTFISNRIAYHISDSLNWGLAAALGSLLLIVVLALYWLYDRMVGIDNVKLG